MSYNDNSQPVICVPYAYGGGAVTLAACVKCGAVVINEENQRRHDEWHEKITEQIRLANVGFGGFGGSLL